MIVLLDKKAQSSIPKGPELVADLIEELTEQRAKIIIPAPVLTEVLTHTKEIQTYLEEIKKSSCFQIRPFDEKAAIELAYVFRASVDSTKKRKKKDLTKQLITFERQIVAVCKVNGADTIYSDDEDVVKFADECGLLAIQFKDLKRKAKQSPLNFGTQLENDNVWQKQNPKLNHTLTVSNQCSSRSFQYPKLRSTREKRNGRKTGQKLSSHI